ncbi:MAG: endonuclease/exonuclease/phosphatase family protein [gamma proteobacterium symbiont of Bathyaustriella thionipta]|nr:endonuclease/exonuclease/phosphatase family protein [gamma proteobacterium symbiont of Bathyaustriella thionipta]
MRILSFNIQTGVDTQHYHHYVTQSWKHVLPNRESLKNLNEISQLINDYDFVGLQEVDAGSLRTGFVDQTEYMAQRAHFPHWYRQINRKIGKISQHSNAMLSRYQPGEICEHKLPGLPGRGALLVKLGESDNPLVFCIIHLALGRRARERQMDFISGLLSNYQHNIVMGDMNCDADAPELLELMQQANLCQPATGEPTFPSWQPKRNLDHILLSPSLQVRQVRPLNFGVSDHLPLHMELEIPADIKLGS